MPPAETGLRGPAWDKPQHRSEEPHLVRLADGTLYCVWRTDQGHIGHSTSTDGGKSWSRPAALTYGPGRRVIKNPLACPSLWKCSNGKYLLWHHNCGVPKGNPYLCRNPAWICGGEEKDGTIAWSEPEIVLYGRDHRSNLGGRISYPGLVEQRGRYWILETQKLTARVHEIDPALFAAAWNQHAAKDVAKDGLALSLDAAELKAGKARMPRLPDLAAGAGFAVGLWITLDDPAPGQVLLDSRDRTGRGIAVSTAEAGAVRLDLSDGRSGAAWACDPQLLKRGRRYHVVFIVDGGPKIITVVVDGRCCDGGTSRQFGWGRFPPDLADVTGGPELKIPAAARIDSLRIYSRLLLTGEAVGNFRAGCGP